MGIVTARRASQVFFLILASWFALVTTNGPGWWQLSGWPVSWLLELDPLTALATALATGTLYAGLAWALVTILLTVLLGRVFCGWVCPFGALHQLVGWLARRLRTLGFTSRVARVADPGELVTPLPDTRSARSSLDLPPPRPLKGWPALRADSRQAGGAFCEGLILDTSTLRP